MTDRLISPEYLQIYWNKFYIYTEKKKKKFMWLTLKKKQVPVNLWIA